MAILNRLTSLQVQRTITEGLYCDGGGLYLSVTKHGSKHWIFRYQLDKKAHWMGLGPIEFVSLTDARDLAYQNRKLLFEGIDPLAIKAKKTEERILAQTKGVTFDECAHRLIANKSWKNLKHRAQWISTLETYANPVFGGLPVGAIDSALVIKALEPIWQRIPETATRVRGRIEAVLAYATASGLRTGENPARWKGHLDAVFAKRSELAPVVHMPALPWRELPAFMAELREKRSHTARAVELLILSALRPGETVGAEVAEFDLAGEVWTVPGERMKKKVTHAVPLSPRMIAIAQELSQDGSRYLFPGLRHEKPMTTASMLKLVKDMRPDIDITAHGFRSCFTDWAHETTNFSREVIEMCLAHKVENAVEASYRRGDLFMKRKRLMAKWEEYCSSIPLVENSVAHLPQRYGIGVSRR